jgi:hypothetical protein
MTELAGVEESTKRALAASISIVRTAESKLGFDAI